MASTLEGGRLTEAHRLAQARLGIRTVADMRAIWPLLDPANIDQTTARWLRAARAVVGNRRTISARLAANYLRTFRVLEMGGPADAIVPVLAEHVDARSLATSLVVTGPVSLKSNTALKVANAQQIAESRAARAAMRHVMNGGRETIVQTVRADRDARGWVRVTSGKPCDYCEGLAGLVFDEGGDFQAHDGCSCGVEPAY